MMLKPDASMPRILSLHCLNHQVLWHISGGFDIKQVQLTAKVLHKRRKHTHTHDASNHTKFVRNCVAVKSGIHGR